MLAKSHLAPALCPCFLYKKGKFHWYFISLSNKGEVGYFEDVTDFSDTIWMMSMTPMEMAGVDAKRWDVPSSSRLWCHALHLAKKQVVGAENPPEAAFSECQHCPSLLADCRLL